MCLANSMCLARLALQTMLLVGKDVVCLLTLFEHRSDESRAATHGMLMSISHIVSLYSPGPVATVVWNIFQLTRDFLQSSSHPANQASAARV
jgi:hypothetical protein